MDKKIMTILCLTILAAAWIIRPHTTLAQAQSKSFAGVFPFVTASGLFGMFDQLNGKVYIYNNDLSRCVYEGQVGELGEPVAKIGGETESAVKSVTYGMPVSKTSQ